MLLGEVVYGGSVEMKPAFTPPETVVRGRTAQSRAGGTLNLPVYEARQSSNRPEDKGNTDQWLYLPPEIWTDCVLLEAREGGNNETGFSLSVGSGESDAELLPGMMGLFGARISDSLALPSAAPPVNDMEWFQSVFQGLESDEERDSPLWRWGGAGMNDLLSGGELFQSDPFSIPSSAGEQDETFWENPFAAPTETP
jgi:hypothetical protein